MDHLFNGLEHEISFRYSNRFIYYVLSFGGWMLWAVIVFFYGERFIDAIGIHSAMDSPFFDKYGTAGFIGLILAIVGSFVLAFIFSFLIARKVTDRQGTAYFFDDYAELHMGNRKRRIVYSDIKKLKYRTVHNAQHGGSGFGPMLYRLHIRTAKGKVSLPCSFKEAWECRKSDNMQPAIYLLAMQFCVRTGIDVKFTAH